MSLILTYYEKSKDLILNFYVNLDSILDLTVKEQIGRFKYVENEKIEKTYEQILQQLNLEFKNLNNKELDFSEN